MRKTSNTGDSKVEEEDNSFDNKHEESLETNDEQTELLILPHEEQEEGREGKEGKPNQR